MDRQEVRGGDLVKRHRVSTRIWHWVNAVAIIVLLMSGMMISNAHPHLYWGNYGANFDQPWFSVGWVIEGGRFPGWATIPSEYSLALGRRWHLAFAWVLAFGFLAYLIISLVNRHIQRDLTIKATEVAPSHLWADIKDHARLRFPTGRASLRYNVIQKLTYIAVIFGLIPLAILTGLSLSPGMNAVLALARRAAGRAANGAVDPCDYGGVDRGVYCGAFAACGAGGTVQRNPLHDHGQVPRAARP